MPLWIPPPVPPALHQAVNGMPSMNPGIKVESALPSALALAAQGIRFEGSLGLIPLRHGEISHSSSGSFLVVTQDVVDPQRGTFEVQSIAADIGLVNPVSVGVERDYGDASVESAPSYDLGQVAAEDPGYYAPTDAVYSDPGGGQVYADPGGGTYVDTGSGYVPVDAPAGYFDPTTGDYSPETSPSYNDGAIYIDPTTGDYSPEPSAPSDPIDYSSGYVPGSEFF